MRDREVGLDLGEQRSRPDELRAQRERGDEQRGQQRQAAALSDYGRTITFRAPSRRSVNVA
jgi:hypothetical protein